MSILFRQFISGQKKAYAVYFHRYYANVYASLKKLCAGDDALAQDLTQDVFKNCWDRRAAFKDETHLANYLFFMAQTLFLQHLRQKKMTDEATEQMSREMTNAENDVDPAMAREHVLVRLELAMTKLPPQQRKVMKLLVQSGLNVRTVAAKLHLAEQTVRNHKTQALIFLRKELYTNSLSLLLLLLIIAIFYTH